MAGASTEAGKAENIVSKFREKYLIELGTELTKAAVDGKISYEESAARFQAQLTPDEKTEWWNQLIATASPKERADWEGSFGPLPLR